MVRYLIPLLCLGPIACAKPPPTSPDYTERDLYEAPRLPSPHAGSYARAVQIPQDPVVRAVVGDRTWDASLAGAAAGLALAAASDTGNFSLRELRESAWQAGYPWPVLSMSVWRADEQAVPPPGVRTWVAKQPAERDIGIVRARGQGRDVWVGLSGKQQIDLGVIPREISLGHQLSLPEHPTAEWRASDGTGLLHHGNLEHGAQIPLDTAGEWLIHVFDEEGDLARFPVYVNDKAPRVGVLPVLNKPVNSSREAHTRAWQLIDIVRDVYGSEPLTPDQIMRDAAVRAHEQASPDLGEMASRFARDPDRALGWRCKATTVEDCIDQLMWDPTTRAPFVDPNAWSGGLSVHYAPGTIEIVGLLAAD